jgi:hypothetical protein
LLWVVTALRPYWSRCPPFFLSWLLSLLFLMHGSFFKQTTGLRVERILGSPMVFWLQM